MEALPALTATKISMFRLSLDKSLQDWFVPFLAILTGLSQEIRGLRIAAVSSTLTGTRCVGSIRL
ncbi:hypothetical protein DXT90_22375 [Agrobacterium tumefaciens]|nr:hypothetical protein [Agrobacterium tumefaciens]